MNTLMFKTRKASGVATSGESPYWIGMPVLRPSVSTGQIAKLVAESRNASVEDVLWIYRRTNEIIVMMLQKGCNVNMELVGYSINLTGKFGSKDGSFEKGSNLIQVSAYSKPILRDCLSGVTARNVTEGLKASIGSVTDDAAFEVDTITVPSRVLVGGVDLLINPANADEGVWLFDKKGELAATPSVTANTVDTIDLDFGELPPDGEYTLVVKARSGASTDYAPATARHTVTVRNA